MFSVIYSFEVKQGLNEELIFTWTELTKLIYKYEGSLGSRLHHASENKYIAYAQWPSRDKWENFGSKLPPEAEAFSKRMKACCKHINTFYELTTVVDLLRDKPQL
ncbi:MAG: antibiotic biosynthesis monooxygenase [Flavobacteriales bacterium]|nr:antibiotic biosynthesis monooxygenase [Flavobacteriales bacterium]